MKTRLLLAGLIAASALSASARIVTQQVVITKASDSRTLTVRYTGAKATLVELRINGASVATRTVTGGQPSGETNFTLDTTKLNDGDNNVEIRIYDTSGKVLGSEKTIVTMDRTASGPVFLAKPSPGESVQGMVDITVGFKSNFKNAYVSFFVNDEFKALKNYPPYEFLWDTSKVANGWHEVEAWVVDESNTTFRTERMRVFVNNPGGRTERESNPSVEPREPAVVPTKPVVPKSGPAVKTVTAVALETSENRFSPAVSRPSGTKAAILPASLTTDLRIMRPTGQRIAGAKPTSGAVTAPKIKSAPTKPVVQVKTVTSNLVANSVKPTLKKPLVKFGTRTKLPNIGYYPISVNGSEVKFDVAPRVESGVALTPFRHLFEHVGGTVKWQNQLKTVQANGLGSEINFKIGQDFATVNGGRVGFEKVSFLEKGRAIVPLSFVQTLLNVEIAYDPESKHVLITKSKK